LKRLEQVDPAFNTTGPVVSYTNKEQEQFQKQAQLFEQETNDLLVEDNHGVDLSYFEKKEQQELIDRNNRIEPKQQEKQHPPKKINLFDGNYDGDDDSSTLDMLKNMSLSHNSTSTTTTTTTITPAIKPSAVFSSLFDDDDDDDDATGTSLNIDSINDDFDFSAYLSQNK
jgi:hypothetical protein